MRIIRTLNGFEIGCYLSILMLSKIVQEYLGFFLESHYHFFHNSIDKDCHFIDGHPSKWLQIVKKRNGDVFNEKYNASLAVKTDCIVGIVYMHIDDQRHYSALTLKEGTGWFRVNSMEYNMQYGKILSFKEFKDLCHKMVSAYALPALDLQEAGNAFRSLDPFGMNLHVYYWLNLVIFTSAVDDEFRRIYPDNESPIVPILQPSPFSSTTNTAGDKVVINLTENSPLPAQTRRKNEAVVKLVSIGCDCKKYCTLNKCACLKAEVKCNSLCHSSRTCGNMLKK
jgi:hypothetical protein